MRGEKRSGVRGIFRGGERESRFKEEDFDGHKRA